MAADFWTSSQHTKWQFSRAQLQKLQEDLVKEDIDIVRQWQLPDPRLVNAYLQQQIAKLGFRFSIQQPALGTAMIFIRRFYLKIQIRKTNPYLLLVTAFYLACKVEETPHHIKTILTEARRIWSDFIPLLTGTLGECEFLLISQIEAQLVIHHPFRPLKELQQILELTEEEVSLASAFINDHYLTNLPFLYPPHIIAAAAVSSVLSIRPSPGVFSAIPLVAKTIPQLPTISATSQAQAPITSKAQKLKSWLVQSDIDVESVINCVQEIVSLYVVLEHYSERDCRDQINRFAKDVKLDK